MGIPKELNLADVDINIVPLDTIAAHHKDAIGDTAIENYDGFRTASYDHPDGHCMSVSFGTIVGLIIINREP
jgi:hypothetical protein